MRIVLVVFGEAAAAVFEPFDITDGVAHAELNNGEERVDNHSADERVSNSLPPVGIEIAVLAKGESKRQGLLRQIRVDQQKEECGVEELGKERDFRDHNEFLGL